MSSTTDCKENNSEGCICPDCERIDELSNENGLVLIGEHENQVSEDGEESLHRYMKYCTKNPGHPEFIPIESFSLENLPDGHRDSDLYDLIKAVADLTVRISVTMTSPDRPDFWPNTNRPYFLLDLRGKKILRTGTGKVQTIWKCTEDYGLTCPYDNCEASEKPSKVWWKFFVDTAARVIFDDTEARNTTLRLFYDSEDSELVILKDKMRVDHVNVEKDTCAFQCVTCDETVGNKLEKMVKRFDDVWKIVVNIYRNSRDIRKFNVIVSHPHGCSKMVNGGTKYRRGSLLLTLNLHTQHAHAQEVVGHLSTL